MKINNTKIRYKIIFNYKRMLLNFFIKAKMVLGYTNTTSEPNTLYRAKLYY